MKENNYCPVTGKHICKKKISCDKCLKFQKHLLSILTYSAELKGKYRYEK